MKPKLLPSVKELKKLFTYDVKKDVIINHMQNYSLTYLFAFLLAGLGVENSESVANAILIVATAIGVLFGRYRAGNISWTGVKH